MYRTLKDDIPDTPMTDKNIILDLDETLVFSNEEVKDIIKLGLFTKKEFSHIKDRLYLLKFKNPEDNIWGITRPHVEEFLLFCFSYFRKVIIWSAGTEDYVHKVCEFLFKDLPQPDMIYTKEDCIMIDNVARLKPLKRIIESEKHLELSEENTFFIDDKDYTFSDNPRNAIHIPGFSLRENEILKIDNHLQDLISWFLKKETKKSKDIRKLDKRKIFSTK